MKRLAFVHIMKTAGSYVSVYLEKRVLRHHRVLRFLNHRTFQSWGRGLGRDWTDDELRGFLELRTRRRLYVHNHVNNWRPEIVEAYRRAGWFTFAFVRHPGDTVCSFYHWAKKKGGHHGLGLDAFIDRHIDSGRPWEIPPYWRQLDYVAEFSDEVFARFLKTYFDHDYVASDRLNASVNRGFDHYVATGDIRPETAERMRASDQFSWYREIVDRTRPVPRGQGTTVSGTGQA